MSLLTEKGSSVTTDRTQQVDGIVSWGCRVDGTELPTLNGNAGKLNKFEELQKLAERGVLTVPVSRTPLGEWESFLGRSLKHTKGTDIAYYTSLAFRRSPGRHDFFTHFIPQQAEFRVWAFRGKCLGIYQKVLTYPRRQRIYDRKHPGINVAWNWGRGYAFEFLHDPPAELCQLGVDAVRALDLDFGAVDVIQAQSDGRYYVLEVNTAPGTRGEPRQGLTYLATKIHRWAENGFKKRNSWKEQ